MFYDSMHSRYVIVLVLAYMIQSGISEDPKQMHIPGEQWQHHAGRWSNLPGALYYLSLCVRKPTIWVPTRSDTNRAVQSQLEILDLESRGIVLSV